MNGEPSTCPAFVAGVFAAADPACGFWEQVTCDIRMRSFAFQLVLSTFLTICMWPITGAGAIYTVEGELHYIAINGLQIDAAFSVSVSNCLWAISTEAASNAPACKQFHDGDVVSSFMEIPPQGFQSSTPANDSVLSVEKTDMPNSIQFGMGPVWLAYASACKFSSGSTGLVELAWFSSLERRTKRFKTPASWINAEVEPFLPSSVNYYFESGEKALPRDTASGSLNPSASATLWATYRTVMTTNIGTVLLPLLFEYKLYEPARSYGQESKLVYQYQGQLLRAYESIPAGTLEHGLGRTTFVQDERYRTWSNPVPVVQYVITNQEIPKVSDSIMLKAYAQGAAFQKARQNLLEKSIQSQSTKRIVLLATLSCLVLIPFVAVLVRKGKPN